MSKTKQNYTADDIVVLKGLDPVKHRPGMYTLTDSPNHIIQEVVDNAKDEALAGFASKITVIVDADGSVTVADNGRGIPTGKKSDGKTAAEVVFTELHSGGKFNKSEGSAYKFSGGLHGVGVSVTNALSTRLDVQIRREGKIHALAFENGNLVEPLKVIGKCPQEETGTMVKASPDLKYFEGPINLDDLTEYLANSAILMPKVEFSIQLPGQEAKIWSYPGGLGQYLQEHNGNTPDAWVAPLFELDNHIEEDRDNFTKGEGVTLSIGWLNEGKAIGKSYVNLINTPEGGKHILGLRSGLFEAMKAFIEHHGLLPKGVKIEADDVYNKACFVLSITMLDPQFQGQTKDKLSSESAVKLVNSMVRDPFELWLNEHLEYGKKLAEVVIDSALARARNTKPTEKRKSGGSAVLPGKLTDCESNDPTKNELFLVEGDSAGGSAKMGRVKQFQAILPLRGKLLNTWEVEAARLYASSTISDISLAIGVEPHGHLKDISTADMSRLRYHRVIIMSDADVDGSHIQVLLLTLFFKHFPRLIRDGHVYIAQSPLYRVDAPPKKGQKGIRKYYAIDESELKKIKDKLYQEGLKEAQLVTNRFKGLGEMNAEQLRETTMHPDTRRLLQIGFIDAQPVETSELFEMLMSSKNAHKRRAWMEEKGSEVEGDY